MTPGSTQTGRLIPKAIVLVVSLLIAGCSSAAPTLPVLAPHYLGASDVELPSPERNDVSVNVTSSKVLSAIVFQRVTGLEVDPARLVER